jgi:hypothetical protein
MSYQKLQGYKALGVLPSDVANVPYPVLKENEIEGSTTLVEVDKLIDKNGLADFIRKGVKPGDIVYNMTLGTAATVVSVDTPDQLTLNANIMLNVGNSYIIYPASVMYSGVHDANNGCVLYVGDAGDLTVTLITGTKVTFKNMPVGFVPIQVKQVWSTNTDAKNIVALW